MAHNRGLAIQQVKVTTNSFEITRLPTAKFNLYDAFKPDIDKKAWRRRADLVRHLQISVHPDIFTPKFLYDGGAVGFAHHATQLKLGQVRTFRVRLRDNTTPPPDAKNVVEVRFQLTQGEQITATAINNCIISGGDSHRRSSLLNFLQLIIRQESNNSHPNNGKAYFPVPGEMKSVGNFLELRRGIFHSVRPAVNRVTVVVDTVVAAFYQSGSLIDGLLAFFRLRDVRDLLRIDHRRWHEAKKFFQGVIIVEKKGNPPRSGGKRKIIGFDPAGAFYSFDNDQGTTTTIADHYLHVHNMRIHHPKLPGLILRERPRKEIVPMEFCNIEPNQFFKKGLPEAITRDMVEFATQKPFEKLARIKGAAELYQSSETMVEAGMTVNPLPITVEDASMMAPPQIEFGRNVRIDVRDGKWNVVGRKLLRTVDRCHWAVVNLASTKIRPEALGRHLQTLIQCANSLGIPLSQPIHTMNTDPYQGSSNLILSLNRFMKDIEMKLKEITKPMLTARQFFILFILEEEAAGPRATLKYWGDAEEGIVTQCVRVNKLMKLRDDRAASQYWNNVALKINPRLGGENSRVSGSSAMAQISRVVTMIVGFDVGHPSPGVRKPSVASMVYNLDPHGVKYTALTRIQDPRQEVIVDLGEMFSIAINDVMRLANGPVENIIIFRDGVSEGEYERIEETEIQTILQVIDHIWDTHSKLQEAARSGRQIPKPKMTYMVVGKRHHSLLFPASPQAQDGKGNCKAGVVVNHGITQPTNKDFYLQSHAAIIGTSRSSHYIVLRDEVFNNTHMLEELAYALCHVYAKATRSVSIPAPVYYADLVCSRESFHFAPSVEEELRASDNASVLSSGAEAPFELQPWKNAFKPRHARLQGNMYFL